MKVYNESIKKWVDSSDRLLYGIVFANDKYFEYGFFEMSPENIYIRLENIRDRVIGISYDILKSNLSYNYNNGYYTIKNENHKNIDLDSDQYVYGNFPYTFEKVYNTMWIENKFNNKQVVYNEIEFQHMEEMPYTFGLEFETCRGYIPQHQLFESGLIPLRDGSIRGLEYSTVVLSGNKGFNLLKQQIDLLRKSTLFDSTCSLHLHLGGYNQNPNVLLLLNNLFSTLNFSEITPSYSFCTEKYKPNGKSYCKKNKIYRSFQDMYYDLVARPFFGDLHQPHPCDLDRKRKWEIPTRYMAVNFINAVCYVGSKTIEYRFLKPSYNFDKIICWIFILSGLLKFAEVNYDKLSFNPNITFSDVFAEIYSKDLCDILNRFLQIQKSVIMEQTKKEDFIGRYTKIEDDLITYNSLSEGLKYFY